MEVKVKFFGMIAEKLEMESTQVDIERFTATDLNYSEVFKQVFPVLKDMTFQVAVDMNLNGIISESTKEIALLPPFAGG